MEAVISLGSVEAGVGKGKLDRAGRERNHLLRGDLDEWGMTGAKRSLGTVDRHG